MLSSLTSSSILGPIVPKKNSTDIYVKFKDKYSFEKRRREYEKIATTFPDKIPVIVERSDTTTIADIDKHKFLVPSDTTMSQFLYVIRKRITLKSDESLFVFINNTLPSMSLLISQLYREHCDPDGFLYIVYSGESTFGTFDEI